MGLEAVKLLVLDHDGVLTDNHVYTDQHGNETCRYYRGDGVGIERLRALGVPVVVISGEVNPVVAVRCEKLRLTCFQGEQRKLDRLHWLVSLTGCTLSEVAYVGNDVNDLECLEAVGHPCIPADAEIDLWENDAFLSLTAIGGDGCVREICDLIAEAKKEAALVRDQAVSVS